MVGTAMERLFTSNPGVQFDAAAWEEFTQLNEMMAMNCIDETFIELQNARVSWFPNGLFISKIRKFLGQMRNNFGGGHGGGHYGGGGGGGGGGNFGGRGGRGNNFNNYPTTITSEEEEEVAAATAAKAVAATAAKAWTIKRSEVRSQRTRTE